MNDFTAHVEIDSPSLEEVETQVEHIRTSNNHDDRELYKSITCGSLKNTNIWAPDCSPEHRHLLHCRFILSRASLDGLIRLSRNPGLCVCIKAISFGIRRITKEARRTLLWDSHVPMSLQESFDFTPSPLDVIELLTEAFSNLRIHNDKIAFGVFDDRQWFPCPPCRQACYRLNIYPKPIMDELLPDTIFTVHVIAAAVNESRGPLQTMYLEPGLSLRVSNPVESLISECLYMDIYRGLDDDSFFFRGV